MDALFPHDQQTNDQLLLDEEDRRRQLIDSAVSRFAPRLADKPGVEVIHLYSTNASLRKYVRELGGDKTVVVEHCPPGPKERKGVNEIHYDEVYIPLPKTADLVVTKSSLNSKVEWLGARLGAMVCVLPEAEQYLRALLEKRRVLVLVGAEQAKA